MLKRFLILVLLQGPSQPANQTDSTKTAAAGKDAAQSDANRKAPEAGSQRNQNIQINLIDNNALNERLGREGILPVVPRDFTAVKSDYASEFGGMGRNIDIVSPEKRSRYHGEAYESLQNNIFNARTFFQVGSVQKAIRNQYGFNVGGPLRGDGLTFSIGGEETRQTGYVNGNVLVPLPTERTPRTTDPAVYAVIARWLAAYPNELPNRPEIDPRMLNTNTPQSIRNSGGNVRLDWSISAARRAVLRYSLRDTFIDSFKFVAGQNPNQRFRPQDLNLSFEQDLTSTDVMRIGVNYLRQKSDLSIPPGAVGVVAALAKNIEDLGPKNEFPMHRIRNDFEYLASFSHVRNGHIVEWGGEARRYQMNDLQSNEARGNFGYSPNFGRSTIENFLAGTPSNYRITLGNLYRGFRNSDFAAFVNDRWKMSANLTLTAGIRYEFAGSPNEVNGLTQFPYSSDRNNFGPRVGFAWSRGGTVARGGYGIAFGRVFPATFQVARFNPPNVLRIAVPNPDLLNPLKDWHPVPGQPIRSSASFLDDNLVVPYTQHYTLEIERQIAGVRVRSAYFGNRTWKLLQTDYRNRAGRPDGIPVTTATINDRRPDPRYYSLLHIMNLGRAYFDAAQLTAEKRASGTLLTASYTWSKAIDTGTMYSSTQINNDEIRPQVQDGIIQDMKAPSLFDVRQSLVISYTVPLKLPTRWLSGWALTGTTLLRTATPFTVEVGSDAPPLGNVDGEWQDRPSILDPTILHKSIDNPDTSQSILRRSAFSADDTFLKGRGNIGRNTFRKDGAANFNAALTRTFQAFADQAKAIVFRAEALNMTNHPQFDAPNAIFSSPSFGQITNTLNAGRIMQFVMNVRF